MEKTNRLNWIDSIKGIAILGIILTHSGAASAGGWLGLLASNGRRAVQVFFILTAFLALTSYERFVGKNGCGFNNTMKWILLRIVRLIPLFYLFTIIYAIIGGAPDWLGSGRSVSIGNIITHLTFIHGFFPLYINSIIGNEWYVAVIAMLYFFIPLFYKWINSITKSVVWFVLSSVICWFIYYGAAKYLVPDNADEYIYNSFFVNFNIIAQLPAILLGVILYQLIKADFSVKIKKPVLASYIILGISVIGIVLIFSMRFIIVSEYAVWGIFLFGICFSQYLNRCPVIDNAFFRILGKNSFAMYLTHIFIRIVYDRFVPELVPNSVINMIIKYIIITIITIFVSVPLTYYFEKPLSEKLVKLIIR